MPLYEYVCSECDSKFEVLRPTSRMDDPVDCPRDHGTTRRVLSTFATVAKDIYGSSEQVGCGGGCSGCSCGSN